MKSTNLVLGMAVIVLGFTSCKDEKQKNKTVDLMLFMLTH
jgi:hypothetical protein